MPASRSAPIDPYLKRISGSFVIQSGCASSRKNLYQPNQAPKATRSAITASAILSLPCLRRAPALELKVVSMPSSQKFRLRGGTAPSCTPKPGNPLPAASCSSLEGLQVFDQRVLVLAGKLGPVSLA